MNADSYSYDPHETYSYNMFQADSVQFGPSIEEDDVFLNEDLEDIEQRLFRYQDKENYDRSDIPIQQRLSRGNPDITEKEELRDSELSKVRSCLWTRRPNSYDDDVEKLEILDEYV